MLLISLIGTSILLAVVKISVENAFSTSGIQYGMTQQKIQVLSKENMILREKLYTQSSLTHIASAAATLGFEPNGKVMAVSSIRPVAYAR